MDFSLTDEQAMLADSISRFVESDYSFESRQAITQSESGYSKEMWRTFAELGWTAMPFAERDGGLGGGPVELTLMMEQFGRGLVVEPYLPTVILAGGTLRRTATGAQKERWLLPLVAGELQAALAFAEPQGRFDLANIATKARRDGEDYVLHGSKTLVLNAAAADLLIVPARTSGSQTEHSGITLFALTDDAMVERRAYRLVDGHQAADVYLDGARIHESAVLGEVGNGYEALRTTIDEGALAVSAEAVGILRALHEKTVDYSKNRSQFGVPIGSFQALQHRMVDMLIACEQCQSSLYRATMLAEAGEDDLPAAISALKYQIGTSGRLVAQEAVQIHGGMGVTWELDIAHYFKRLSTIETLFGNADHHLDRYVAFSCRSR